MTPIRLSPDRIFYRFHSPQWASLPISGAGAARHGGRFNRIGSEALYLSADVPTALAEYMQEASIPQPGTLVAYQLDIDGIIDFSAGFAVGRWPAGFAEFACDWKDIAHVQHLTPPSWEIGDLLVGEGHCGLLFPSTRRLGGVNLVLFTANLAATDRIAPYDPNTSLPRDQSSWPTLP